MFKWLTKLFSIPKRVDLQLQFVKNLCEQQTPHVYSSWSLGYLYVFSLHFTEGLKIKVEYNIVRHKWDMEIWSGASNSFLFYHDCLSTPPRQTINYLIERYNLLPTLEKAIELKNQEKAKSKKREEEIIKKYTS